MKQLKKLASLLLAMVMVFGLAATALATDEQPTEPSTPEYQNMEGTLTGGSITINNAVEGQKYNLYQIMYLVEYDTVMVTPPASPSTDRAYKANEKWDTFLREDATEAGYVSVDTNGYVTWLKFDAETGEPIGAKEFAELAINYAKDTTHPISPLLTDGITATGTTVEFPDLTLGYYLVDSTLGTLCSLDDVNPDANITEKNAEPTNYKEVEEDSVTVPNDPYGKVNDADIGETVDFRSTITLPRSFETVVYHDKMSPGLALTENSVKVYTDEAMQIELEANKYTVNYNPAAHQNNDGSTTQCTFDVVFNSDYLNGLTADTTTLYIGYSATINASAVIGDTGNPNESHLEYGDDGNISVTPPSETITYVWSFDILKYANGDKNVPLADAQFVLLRKYVDPNDENPVEPEEPNQVAIFDANYKLVIWENIPAAVDGVTTWPAGSTLVTPADGKINVEGLDSGTYYLRETKAPDGYNMLTEDVPVTIEPDINEAGEDTTMTLREVTIPVNNNSGTNLPSTGGIGTTIFYVVGSVLLVGAAILLITKKRMSVSK